jgi:hypothetical protein
LDLGDVGLAVEGVAGGVAAFVQVVVQEFLGA